MALLSPKGVLREHLVHRFPRGLHTTSGGLHLRLSRPPGAQYRLHRLQKKKKKTGLLKRFFAYVSLVRLLMFFM